MKGLFFVFVVLTFVSCQNNIEQYRTGIEELGSKWDSISTSVNSFAEKLNMENNNFTAMVSSMNTEDAMFAKLSEEEQAKITTAKASITNAGAGFGEMVKTVETFTTEWTTKAAEVTALKDGLTSGKLEGDVAAKLTELNTYLADAGTKVTEWNTQLETMKSTIAATQSEYSTLVAGLTPAEK